LNVKLKDLNQEDRDILRFAILDAIGQRHIIVEATNSISRIDMIEIWEYFNNKDFENNFNKLSLSKRIQIGKLLVKYRIFNNINKENGTIHDNINDFITLHKYFDNFQISEVANIFIIRSHPFGQSSYWLEYGNEIHYNYYNYLKYLIENINNI